jgi:hypothetical protein
MKFSIINILSSSLIALMLFDGMLTKAADYGYNLGNDESCALWWAEGTYKIMQQDPIPNGKIQPVKMHAAGNEYESIQIVLRPHETMSNFKIEFQDFKSESGGIIAAGNITVRKVEYVHVIWPTDDYGKPGWYPDPLPLFYGPIDLEKDRNHPFYITIHIPGGTLAGKYIGSIQLSSDGWNESIPVSIEVWNFMIPENPSVRSSFGIGTETIRQYHNLNSDEELRKVSEKYYSMMNDYYIAPTNPFSLHPMIVNVDGLDWVGGLFTDETVHSGGKSLKVVDDKLDSSIEAFTHSLIEVDPASSYSLSWHIKTALPEQKYCVLLKCYDAGKQIMLFENRMDEFTGQGTWEENSLVLRPFRKEIKYVTIHLYPVFRDNTGSQTGTAWFDDVSLVNLKNRENLVPQGGFEVDARNLDISVDFTEFDKAGKKFLDEMGFNAFHLPLEGLPSGSFYAQRRGEFKGFSQGTPEYDYLMKEYLTIVQEHLEEMGWLGKDYVYWFDEPNTENYPFVREGMEIIHNSAPKITRFITEHRPGPDIMDVTEISCTVIGQLDPDIIRDLVAQGREFWSYVCCCPKAPFLSLFIDHDAINMRMWLWLSYKFQMKGILIWSANYWNSSTASPENYLQNPWEDPMAYTVGYGLPFGKQSGWGNGDGRLFYPPNRNPNDHTIKYLDGPVPCLRLENIRDGIEDYEYLRMLDEIVSSNDNKNSNLIKRARKLLAIPESLVTGPTDYNKDPQSLIQYRNKIGDLLNTLNTIQ